MEGFREWVKTSKWSHLKPFPKYHPTDDWRRAVIDFILFTIEQDDNNTELGQKAREMFRARKPKPPTSKLGLA